MDYLTWLLQILILTLGIYLFLRFLRTTQGNRIVRGLAIAVPLLIIVTWGTAYTLQLEELRHILRGVAGFAVVFVAILFQEELRRGMAQFGANPLVRRFVPSFETDVLEEVCRAALDMATKQETHGSFTRIRPHGALICFQREASLQSYIEGGRRIEARVSHELLEAIFQPKSPLHDGAVVIRKDRIAAASCMLPLTQNLSVSKTMGTRHRAAIGLSEETDAVVLVVSEETGKLSIAVGGKLAGVPQGDLADELRAALGQSKQEQRPSFAKRLKGFFSEDLPWVASSILVALMMLYIARQDISISREFTVRLVQAEAGTSQPPVANEVVVRLPGEDWRLKEPSISQGFTIEAKGSRLAVEQLGLTLAGSFTLEDAAAKESFVDIDDISWVKSTPFGVSLDWQGEAPRIVTERYGERSFTLTREMVPVDRTNLDPHFEVGEEQLVFDATSVTVVGPESSLQRLGTDELRLRFEPIVLGREDQRDRTELLDLPPELRDLSFSLADDQLVRATVPIDPATYEFVVTVPVVLVALTAADQARLDDWDLPVNAAEARFRVSTSGLLPTIPASSPLWQERNRAIRNYIDENLRGFIDIADQPEGEPARALRVHHHLRDPDWLGILDAAGELERAGLSVDVTSGEVFLVPSTTTEDDG